FATFCSVSINAKNRQTKKRLTLLALGLLLASDCAAARTLSRAGVRMRTLPANRQVAAVTDAPIRLDFDQPADVHLNLLAEIAFHAAFFFDFGTETVHFIFRQVADLLVPVDVREFRDFLRAHLSDAIDRRQSDPEALLRRKIYTSDTCHV